MCSGGRAVKAASRVAATVSAAEHLTQVVLIRGAVSAGDTRVHTMRIRYWPAARGVAPACMCVRPGRLVRWRGVRGAVAGGGVAAAHVAHHGWPVGGAIDPPEGQRSSSLAPSRAWIACARAWIARVPGSRVAGIACGRDRVWPGSRVAGVACARAWIAPPVCAGADRGSPLRLARARAADRLCGWRPRRPSRCAALATSAGGGRAGWDGIRRLAAPAPAVTHRRPRHRRARR